jgi:hypothetical protein
MPSPEVTDDQPLYPRTSSELASHRSGLAPETHDAFQAFSRQVFADGALPEKTKQLIAVAVAHVTHAVLHPQPHAHRAAQGCHRTGDHGGDLGRRRDVRRRRLRPLRHRARRRRHAKRPPTDLRRPLRAVPLCVNDPIAGPGLVARVMDRRVAMTSSTSASRQPSARPRRDSSPRIAGSVFSWLVFKFMSRGCSAGSVITMELARHVVGRGHALPLRVLPV